MRHRKWGVKLNRTSSHRKAMFRNMVTSLLKHEKIRTTDAKAKAIRAWVDHLITLAKRGDLHARRQALAIVNEKKVVHKLFAEAEERFGSRNGGYTRIVKLGHRKGDAAPMSVIELITEAASPKKKLFEEEEKKIVAPTVEKQQVENTEEESELNDPDVTADEESAETGDPVKAASVATEEPNADRDETGAAGLEETVIAEKEKETEKKDEEKP